MLNQFKCVEKEYKGTDFWMMNDKLNKEELSRQLELIHEQGVYSVLIRTFLGIDSDYPGKDFIDKMHTIVDKAKKLGMTVLLQAKYMPECIPQISNNDALSHIIPKNTADVSECDKIILECNGVSYILKKSDSILDIFSEKTVKSYLKECYEDMWSEFKEEYGKTILSIWVDEPAFGREFLPWPNNFETTFYNRYGYSITENVDKLYFNTGNYKKVRFDYWMLLENLIENNYFKQLQAWCKKNNLKASGHLLAEDSLESQILLSCGSMPYYKYFDVPGIDYLTMSANWAKEPVKARKSDTIADLYKNYLTPIQIISAVKQFGNEEHVLCEMYGVSSQNATFRNQKFLFDYFAAFGVNHRSVHGMFYSLRGRRKRGFPPHISYYQPYWNNYGHLLDYIARISKFVRFGNYVSNVLVLHPLNHCRTLYHGNQNREVSEYDKFFHGLIKFLKSIQCDFDLGDSATIRDLGSIDENNKFRIGKMAYSVVVLPDISIITKKEFELLKTFSQKGGKIICYNNVPALVHGESVNFSAEINSEFVDNFLNLKQMLSEYTSFELSGTDMASHIITHHRKDDTTDYFMLMNTDCSEKKSISLKLKGSKTVRIWNGETGETQIGITEIKNGETIFKTTIGCGDNLLLSFENSTDIVAVPLLPSIKTMYFTDGWSMERSEKNVYLLEYCKYKTDGDFSNIITALGVNELLTRQNYNGKVSMKFEFVTDAILNDLYLALECPEEYEIYFNSKAVENKPERFYLANEFKMIKLPDVCKNGKNEIIVETNFLPLQGVSSGFDSLFARTYGSEIENMFLIGDFECNGIMEHNINSCNKFNRNFILERERDDKTYSIDDITTQGYPFYSGSVTFKNKFFLEENAKSCLLKLTELFGACAEIYVNGQPAGVIFRGEAEVDITQYVTNGENVLEFKICNTLRNLLGPHHTQIGESGNNFVENQGRVQGTCYGYFDEQWLSINTLEENWEDKIDMETSTWTPSYNLLSFGAEGVIIQAEY